MRLYLTLGDDGKGVVTHRRPVIARVEGTNRRGVYPSVLHGSGDAVLFRGLCVDWITQVLGFLPDPCEPVELRVDVEVVPASLS